MNLYNYVETPNSNLICCICRAPFVNPTTSRTCSHTFCYDCIIEARQHSPHCPVDRSPLSEDDLLPVNPIVRNLVDELIVECPHHSIGCSHTCQRQLLASHLKDTCQYVMVPCSEEQCSQMLMRKDLGRHAQLCTDPSTECAGCGESVKTGEMETHFSECLSNTITCQHCSAELPRSQKEEHESSCPDIIIPCSHVGNGCLWTGPRRLLLSSHLASCPYESLKGFFNINASRISALTNENIILRQKAEALEGIVLSLRVQLQVIQATLGPWYHSDVPRRPSQPIAFAQIDNTTLNPPSHSITQRTPSFDANIPSLGDIFEPFYSPAEPDALAPYFPPVPDSVVDGPNSQQAARRLHSYSHISSISPSTSSADVQLYPPFHATANPSAPNASGSHALSHRPSMPLTPVAPLNLSTSLEGSLSGLRESIVAVSASVDSLARRNDIALTNEILRINEDLGSLRYAVHGIRLQVHRMMMDRNAQVTGRVQVGDAQGLQQPPPPPLQHQMFHLPVMSPPFPGPAGTKL